MKLYNISRGALSLVIGLAAYLLSQSIWIGAVGGITLLAVFLYLPRSGRYKVNPAHGAAPMKRDEWSQHINAVAGRNAWAVVGVIGGVMVLYFSWITPGDVPVSALAVLLFSGLAVYYGTDYWLRRL
jgi:hypothetical protein